MKLFLINEVFDRPNLDGVKIKESSSGSTIYTFKDEINSDTYEYTVDIIAKTRLKIPEEAMGVVEEFKSKHPNAKNTASIYMEVSKNGGLNTFNETGLGNQWLVYGKLIACVNHFVVRNKPITLEFGGATDSMDLVYDRFIKMSQKHYPQDVYVPYLGDIYVRKDILEKMPETYDMTVARDRRKKQLESMKQHKNYMRAHKKDESGGIDESIFFEPMDEFQINEVFDRPSMDGVNIDDSGRGTAAYDFKDENIGKKYIVKIYGKGIDDALTFSSVLGDDDDDMQSLDKYSIFLNDIKTQYPNSVGTAVIHLSSIDNDGNESFRLTNAGNQWLVYSKLIACLNDYMNKYKPITLKFSGASKSMDLIYDRFIKMSKKTYPEHSYVPLSNDVYIRKEMFEMIEDEKSIQSSLASREARLKNIRKDKNKSRRRNLRKLDESVMSILEQYQINEVFDRPSMDGVTITDNFGFGEVMYDFDDEDNFMTYNVAMLNIDHLEYTIPNLPEEHESVLEYFEGKNNSKTLACSIYLTAAPMDDDDDDGYGDTYEPTGIGNQWFVYSKLIACINDFITKYKPLILNFSGSTDDMNLVYDRFIKMSQKHYPQDAYVPYLADTYIRKEIFDELSQNSELDDDLYIRSQRLNEIRKKKNANRNSNIERNTNELPDL